MPAPGATGTGPSARERVRAPFFGFTTYLTLGAFMMQTFNMSDAYHIVEPLISDTPLTAWVMAPMYAAGYALVLWIVELVKKKTK